MSKIVSTNKINAIFLAVILVAGTISSFTSSFLIGVNAQYDPFYGYNSYEPTEYPPEYADREYNSYEQEYGMHDERKSYENNNYQTREPPSYQPDYKPQYSSYEQDNKYDYKSKKESSSSVSLNKLNCVNNNVNINGNNTGDINVGNSGKSATGSGTDEGYLGVGSLGGNGEGYDNGYNKHKDKGFTCIINNNNTNTNIGGGNQTISPELNVIKIVTCTYYTGGLQGPPCEQLENRISEDQFRIQVTNDNPDPPSFDGSESGTVVTLGAGNYVVSETPDASVQIDVSDLEDDFRDQSGVTYEITGPIPSFRGDCTSVNAGFEATGTIGAGESQTCEIENHFDIRESPQIAQGPTDSSIITQGTADSSALANIAKLKAQWLDLLP